MKTMILVIAVCISLTSNLYAQTPTSWQVKAYNSTTGVQVGTTTTYPAASVPCNQTTLPQGDNVTNPELAGINDPVNAGQQCQFNIVVQVQALPDGTYVLGFTAVNAAGASMEGTRTNPFLRVNPPAVPTGARIIK